MNTIYWSNEQVLSVYPKAKTIDVVKYANHHLIIAQSRPYSHIVTKLFGNNNGHFAVHINHRAACAPAVSGYRYSDSAGDGCVTL